MTTVHTDPPDDVVGDPGSILHEAVGNVQFMLIAVDCGPGDLAVYGAPVLSHYEFEQGPATRMTDAEWKSHLTTNVIPPHRSGPKATWFPSLEFPRQATPVGANLFPGRATALHRQNGRRHGHPQLRLPRKYRLKNQCFTSTAAPMGWPMSFSNCTNQSV